MFNRSRKLLRTQGPHVLQILSDHRILVVEDEALIAFEIEEAIRDAGGVVVGPFATVGDAMRLVETEDISAAILDMQLGPELVAAHCQAPRRKRRSVFVLYCLCG